MSATFRALTEADLCDVGYGMVHKVRIAMLQYVGGIHGIGTEWGDRYERDLLDRDEEDMGVLFDEMRRVWWGCDDDMRGLLDAVLEFCDHSDCDGRFYECGAIAEAITATLGMEGIPEHVRDRMEELQEVFATADDRGFVEITRGNRVLYDWYNSV